MNTQFQNIFIAVLCMFFLLCKSVIQCCNLPADGSIYFPKCAVFGTVDEGQKSEKQVILCLLLVDTYLVTKLIIVQVPYCIIIKKMFLFFIKYGPTHVRSYYQ